MTWGRKGALLLAGCLAATLVAPVISYSCRRSPDGAVSCRVTRHAFGFVPFWWTRIERVVSAEWDFSAARRVRGRSGGKALVLSETVTAIRGADMPVAEEWTTYATIGAESGRIAIAIDELVAGTRSAPLLAWQANGVVAFAVFVVALPLAAAMLARPYCERHVARRERWLTVIQRTYVAVLVLGGLVVLGLWWGSVP